MFHAQILHQNLGHSSFWNPNSVSSPHTVSRQSLLIAARTHSTSSGVLLVAGPFNSFSTIFEVYVPHFYLHCTILQLIALSLKAFWITWIVSAGECSSLTKNMMQIGCSTHCHFECNSPTVDKLTQQCLLPPLTSRMKLPLFMHAHSSPLSFAPMLHWCHTSCSCYVLVILIRTGLFPGRPCTGINLVTFSMQDVIAREYSLLHAKPPFYFFVLFE